MSPCVNDEVDAREGSSNCSARGNPGRLNVGDAGDDPNETKRLHTRNVSPEMKQTKIEVLMGRSVAAQQSDRLAERARIPRWRLTKGICGIVGGSQE